jgi:hypothetical protein
MAKSGAPPAPGIARQLHGGNLMNELNAVPCLRGRSASSENKACRNKRYGNVPK